MKSTRVLMLGLALGLASTQAHAFVDVSAFGGYATLAMGDVNNALNNFAGSGTKTDINSGFYVGADAGFTVMPFLKIGPRLKYIQSNQGSATSGAQTGTIAAGLMMYELGLSADTSLPLTGLSLEGGIWGGYGMANASVNNNSGGPTQTGTGSSFVGEVGAQLRYKLFMGLSLGVDLAYALADVKTVNASNGQPMLQTGSGNAAAFDFSGLNAGGALSWDF